MIADDMMSFIKSDIIVFGFGVLLFIIAHCGLFLKVNLDYYTYK